MPQHSPLIHPKIPSSLRLLVRRLDLEALGLSATTTLLELPSLRDDVRLATVERSTKVSDSVTDVALATEEDSVGTGRGTERKLVQGQGLTTVGDDAVLGRLGETQSSDRKLGDLRETLVIEDGADNDNSLRVVLVGLLGVLEDLGDRHGRAVDLGHK